MKIQFATPSQRRPGLLSEVEIHFQAEIGFEGLKLVGFKLWKNRDGELYVTLPGRAYNVGKDRQYFDYLRSSREVYDDTGDIRERIIQAYENL